MNFVTFRFISAIQSEEEVAQETAEKSHDENDGRGQSGPQRTRTVVEEFEPLTQCCYKGEDESVQHAEKATYHFHSIS